VGNSLQTYSASFERALLLQPGKPVLILPTPKGWKAELTLVVGYIKMVYLSADSHPSE